ncbi:hypothetical protein MPSI1_000520 [Malassezia psittaci]|uniref:Uncharacterized protein n=1 Tax=Malassezia psittaci TaxID=1821823 RepID=A0AAF0F3C9_9BASI|nr:hypothetical protein MPSI1_000520 [Malassezia psittaci]
MVKLSTPVALLAVAVAGVLGQSAAPTSAAAGAASSGVCSALFDPKASQLDCQYSSTTVPPYNLPSLVNYMIAAHTPGAVGQGVSEVANEMANSVVKYYPTVTASKSEIVYSFYQGIVNSINGQGHKNFSPADEMKNPVSGAMSKYAVPAAAAAVAVVAGGAVLL